MLVSLLQLAAKQNITENLARAEESIELAVRRDSAEMVVLPEHFGLRELDVARRRHEAEEIPGGRMFIFLQEQAKKHGIWVHGGSFAEREGECYYNTSLVFDPEGRLQAKYRKIFLFDYTAPDGTQYRESQMNSAGNELVTYRAGGLTFGCTVCYDLRFPDLFLALARADVDVIVVPACFTFNTTRDHWETLMRARAIDTQCFLLGCNQFGALDDGSRWTGGRSMLVDPWGTISAQAPDEVTVVTSRLEPGRLDDVRSRFHTALEVRNFQLRGHHT